MEEAKLHINPEELELKELKNWEDKVRICKSRIDDLNKQRIFSLTELEKELQKAEYYLNLIKDRQASVDKAKPQE